MGTVQYQVKPGERLETIAVHYRVDTEALAKENGLTIESHITPGQKLNIPDKRNKQVKTAQPPKSAEHAETVKVKEGEISTPLGDAIAKETRVALDWMKELLAKLRAAEANECMQKTHTVEIKKNGQPASYIQQPEKKKHSRTSKKHDENVVKFKGMLPNEPNICGLHGVKLTENEKKQIVASVAFCEMNDDGFGSIGADYEFVGRSEKFKTRGAETSYSRIVHIGLSYGLIQFIQDGESLGWLLQRFDKKNHSKFVEIFGGGSENVAKSLIELTTTGHPDFVGKTPDSGLNYWKKIRKTSDGKNRLKLSKTDADEDGKPDLPHDKEIRGKRVQAIAPTERGVPIDIWTGVWKERFLAAGKFIEFQEAQLDEAVEKYMNKVLPLAKKNNVRSAIALALITAGCVRGGAGSPTELLIYDVAKDLGILPFKSAKDELKCVKIIAAGGRSGHVEIGDYEAERAKKLLEDELGFLAEDLYDVESYC